MSSSVLSTTSNTLIVDNLQPHPSSFAEQKFSPSPSSKQMTPDCHQLCMEAFAKIRLALRKADWVPQRRVEIKSLFHLPSDDLLTVVHALFNEIYGFKLDVERENLPPSKNGWESYKGYLILSETDIAKIKGFDTFRNKLLSELPRYIQDQEKCPTYLRSKLTALAEASMNPPVAIGKPPAGVEFYAKGVTFYGWNAEGVQDHGWGCAWRAIQTCLSSYGVTVSFRELFHLIGRLDNLQTIYHDKYPQKFLPSSKKFAPYESGSGWAEPFFAEMALHFYDISASLESLNAIPKDCNAPHEVFHRPSLTFGEFKDRLEQHFKQEHAAPLMIDDGSYSYNILGLGCQDSNLTLWIADPHIKEGANRAPSQSTPVGLYSITLNNNGKQIACSLNNQDKHQKPLMQSAGSYNALCFNQKPWMVLFPQFIAKEYAS